MSLINRNVFLLSPKKPLFDWCNQIFPDDPMEFNRKPFGYDQAHAYLIPELDSPLHFEKWIQKYYHQFFEDLIFPQNNGHGRSTYKRIKKICQSQKNITI